VLAIAALGAVALWLLVSAPWQREDGDASSGATSTGQSFRLTTTPTGATVYRATDGQELGRTPLLLDHDAIRGSTLQLHLRGYEMLSLTVSTDAAEQHVTLHRRVAP
jgi:hypothetical protein